MTSTTPDPAIVATIPQALLEEIVRDADVVDKLRARADALEHAAELAQLELDRRAAAAARTVAGVERQIVRVAGGPLLLVEEYRDGGKTLDARPWRSTSCTWGPTRSQPVGKSVVRDVTDAHAEKLREPQVG